MKKLKQTAREKEAQDYSCVECRSVAAENFCGAWVNDGSNEGRGRECRRPLHRACADVRLNVWLCGRHGHPHKNSARVVNQVEWERLNDVKGRVF